MESAVQLFGPNPEVEKLAKRKQYDADREKVLKGRLKEHQAVVNVEDTLTLSLGSHLSKEVVESAESSYLRGTSEEMKATHKSRTKKGFTPEREEVRKQVRTSNTYHDLLDMI